MSEYAVNIPNFEGPFDLLLDLIAKQKISIYDISITTIIDRYISQVSQWQKERMDITGDFIVMASRLLEIKSRYMLYLLDEKEEEDPSLEIRRSLELYQLYKDGTAFFVERFEASDAWYTKKGTEVFIQEELNKENLTLELLEAYKDKIFVKKQEVKPIVNFRIIPIHEKIVEIQNRLQILPICSFGDLIDEEDGNAERVVVLLSLLEMMKIKEVKSTQKEVFGEIHIEKQEDFDGDDKDHERN